MAHRRLPEELLRLMPTRFRVGATFTSLEITSEPYLVLTFRGYTGAVEVRETITGNQYELLIGGIKSLAESLEPLRASNEGMFTGLRFRLKKETGDRFSPYVVASDNGRTLADNVSPAIADTEKLVPTEEKLWHRVTERYQA